VADALKTFFNPALVRRLGGDLAAAMPGFAEDAFVAQATKGLGALELLDRGRHIMTAMRAHLPADYPRAVEVIVRSLGAPHVSDELEGAGMAPFYYLPHTQFVGTHSLDHFDVSMDAQHALTQRFTCEWSIRGFIARDPERTFRYFKKWARDKSPHVRRLVSEGTRIRLPWASRVGWLDANPHRIVELLELLVDDPATVVRRSVANNLNDLGKLDGDLLVETCRSWLAKETPARRALVEHALRSAVKRGEPKALALLGYGGEARVAIENVKLAPKRVAIGDSVSIELTVRSELARSKQSVLVDLVVHFVKANGKPSPKVFKLSRAELGPGGHATFKKTISLAVHTTRKPQRGRHAVEVLINGQPTPVGAFDVV
jgi:3-methyladenine DNA glycosylase AlkC